MRFRLLTSFTRGGTIFSTILYLTRSGGFYSAIRYFLDFLCANFVRERADLFRIWMLTAKIIVAWKSGLHDLISEQVKYSF